MLTVRLLGPPSLERDGLPLPAPRGRKAWALLGFLLLADRPVSRQHLAQLLFEEAEDPLRALRWSLSELRRALGQPGAFEGDPVQVSLSATLDISGAGLLAAEGELLEGVHLDSCPELESWLVVARHRMSAVVEGRLRDEAIALLAAGRAAEAVPYAARAVARNPLEEGNHELLVRAFARAGDRNAALRQGDVCADLIRRGLGTTVSSAVRDAADVPPETAPRSATTRPLGGRAAAQSQLEAGRAAIIAGAVDAGVQCLRRAVDEAAGCQDTALQARALVALGSALVHAVRGRDEEGAVALQESLLLATSAGDRTTAVTAHRELGFIEVQAGRRQSAARWLGQAAALAETDEELAPVLGQQGMNASDWADYPTALAALEESVERSTRAGDGRQQAWSRSLLARVHVLRGERAQAARQLSASLDLVRRERWLAFQPWPQSFQAELALADGDVDGAAESLEQAWAMACQLGDPCWEGVSARGLGMVHAARGDHPESIEWLDEAARRSERVSDRYQWVTGYVLDAAVTAALDRGDDTTARALVGRLASLAARCDLRELVVRGLMHQGRLGDPAAWATARMLGRDIDNPALAELLA